MINDDNFNPVEYFLNPKESAQKRYEALRAYFLESLTQKEAAKRAGIFHIHIPIPRKQFPKWKS